MNTRLAKNEDIEECVKMGMRFAESAGQLADEHSVRATVSNLIEDEVLVVAGEPPIGMIGILVYQNYMRRSETIAQELFWWVDHEFRATRIGISLLNAAESLAKRLGAKKLLMLCLDDLDGDRVQKLYQRKGYSAQERSFVKVL